MAAFVAKHLRPIILRQDPVTSSIGAAAAIWSATSLTAAAA
jgi:hypothetical protein